MLKITIPGVDLFDETKEEFVTSEPYELRLEHSLVSLSKWESIYEKPFLGDADKSHEEILGYIEAMNLDENPPEDLLNRLTDENVLAINTYIDSKRTATWFNEEQDDKKNQEVVTSELIYYWMIALQIPFECERWHLNRLITLIRVCNIKNQKPKKMSKTELAARNRELNARRKAQMGTKG